MSSSNATERRPWSLAARLALWYGASTFLLLLAVEGYLFWAMESSLNRDEDHDMAERVAMVQRLLAEWPQDLTLLQDLAQWKSPEAVFDPIFIRVLDDGGRVLAETTGMSDLLPITMFPATSPLGVDRLSTSGRPCRVLPTQRFQNYRIQVAIDYADE